MDVKFTEAVAAMNKAAGLGGQGMEPRETSQTGAFAQMVKNVAQEVVATGKEGEKMAVEAIAGNAALADVAIAVSNAEITLQTVTAVRDRIIGAYQDILKMPI